MEYTQNLICENDNCKHVHAFDERVEVRNKEGWNDLLCPNCQHDTYYEIKLSKWQKQLLDAMAEKSSKPISENAIGRHKWINTNFLRAETGLNTRIINYHLMKLVDEGLILKQHNPAEYSQYALKSLKGFVINGNLINAIATTEGGQR
ncbi:hypothetical protein QQ054_32020 [Oscillatoria amoena NRMC-F 0135]|nr:hypothetical protein [Oscillatoria amoena NRMC-F 0135]